MKYVRLLWMCLWLLLTPVGTLFAQTDLKVQSAEVTFKIKNAGFTVNGSFSGFESEIRFRPDQLGQSSIRASVKSATIDTGIGARDSHLRKPDYFDVEKHPDIVMQSLRIEKQSANSYKSTFRLTIKGRSREVELPFAFVPGKGAAGTLQGEFTINRLDFGVGSSSWVLSDEVRVFLKISLAPQS